MEWIDDEDELRFRVAMPPGPAQDQALSDVSHGLLRGASLEFIPSKEKPIELGDSPLYEITEGACCGSRSWTTAPTRRARCSG